jgi:hypothetical protein
VSEKKKSDKVRYVDVDNSMRAKKISEKLNIEDKERTELI